MAPRPTPSYLFTNDQQGECNALSPQCPHPSTVQPRNPCVITNSDAFPKAHTSTHTRFQQTPCRTDTFPSM
ncbi:hypothetical protein ES319_D08G128700v1 [Gossypium barbadense]|uniref:Uncharacterized protein n=1 Tax=Gossypium barbadense TaxID=3634 RepID=A0A5J5QE09_GOSBA|nr:hypothetical protein ES319_D08G128700v1 [Gossypium barbadense]